ncbi:phosphatase [Rhodocytophaga rosea]|uniref:Phosphatase n=2 Tax=Rhodocytophaga rosea TaxID=2704465 RepID=A0A6C0GMI2_9BACT|nr:phosphatase [Rhodocytophaga rosea]
MLSKIYRFFKRMKVDTLKPFGKDLAKDELRISICDLNKDIAKVFADVFAQESSVEILLGNLLHLSADALVSPANSFGDMGGGLDKAIDDFFAGQAQQKVQQLIREEYFGELPVGVASIIAMNHPQFPFIIVAPTMRIPGNVGKTINAYLAMRAVLVAIVKHNRSATHPIRHIVLSSLCTGVGGMPFQEAAEQMKTAIASILGEGYKTAIHPAVAPYALGAKWVLPEKLNKFK